MSAAAALLFTFALLWCLFWIHTATRSTLAIMVVAAWGALHWLLAARGIYTVSTAFPPPQAALLTPVLLALLITLILPKGRAWLRTLPLSGLTALHVLRVPVELVLHEAWTAGLVPRDMTYSGFNFDIASGISAAFMLAWMSSRRSPGRTVLIAWNLVCLVLLFIVVITAVLSIPSSVQRINFDQPNVLVLDPPWILLPAVLVPAVLWAHVAALVQLLRPREYQELRDATGRS